MSIVGRHCLGGKHFFILEDEPLIAMDLEYALYSAGAGVVDVRFNIDDETAVAAMVADAAILDLNIRGQYSFDIIARLKASGTPVLVITGMSGDYHDPVLEGLPRLSKPFNSEDLIEVLDKMLA